MALQGWARAQYFSAENFARRVEAAYKKCIETRPKKTVYITLPEFLNRVSTHVIDVSKNDKKNEKKDQ